MNFGPIRTFHLFVFAMALGALCAGLSGCGESRSKTGEQKTTATGKETEHAPEQQLKLSPEEMTAAGIKVEEIKPAPLSEQIVVTAVIRPNQDRIANVAPRVPARITRVSANLGDKVRPGQSLALLDSVELGEAHSAYQQALSQFQLAKADFERAERLKAEDIIPEKDFLRARSDYEKARATLRAAEEKLKLLDASHVAAEKGPPSVFSVNAPFAGIVIEKDAVLGELAQPDKRLFTIADLSVLWIEASLFEKDLGRVHAGARAMVSVTAYPGESFEGRLTYIASTMDRETRTARARIEVRNADGRLKPEMFAMAAIDTPVTRPVLALPQDAVLLVNGQPTVFVAEGQGFKARPVEAGQKFGRQVVIVRGLREGERVATAGAYALKAQMLKSQIGEGH